MKKLFLLIVLASTIGSVTIAQKSDHTHALGVSMDFPNILGYKTLKCDFHQHTVFSDGDVWPSIRVR